MAYVLPRVPNFTDLEMVAVTALMELHYGRDNLQHIFGSPAAHNNNNTKTESAVTPLTAPARRIDLKLEVTRVTATTSRASYPGNPGPSFIADDTCMNSIKREALCNGDNLDRPKRKCARRLQSSTLNNNKTDMISSDDDDSCEDSDYKYEDDLKKESSLNTSSEDDTLADDTEDYVKIKRKKIDNSTEMVKIGQGYASVPASLLRRIDWRSYTSAVRKLLSAVFSRKVLATHSLTGRPSPAFPDKPAKKKLDPLLVDDIVQTVCERCNVPENIVRTSITTKCADESKMMRHRVQNGRRLSKKENQSPRGPASLNKRSS